MIGSEADVVLSGGDEMQRRRRSVSSARAGDHGDRDGGRRRRAQQDYEAGSAAEDWTHETLLFSSDDGPRDRNPGVRGSANRADLARPLSRDLPGCIGDPQGDFRFRVKEASAPAGPRRVGWRICICGGIGRAGSDRTLACVCASGGVGGSARGCSQRWSEPKSGGGGHHRSAPGVHPDAGPSSSAIVSPMSRTGPLLVRNDSAWRSRLGLGSAWFTSTHASTRDA